MINLVEYIVYIHTPYICVIGIIHVLEPVKKKKKKKKKKEDRHIVNVLSFLDDT